MAAMAFTTLLSQAAWANNQETTLLAPVFEADELSAAFEQSAEPMQMLALSEQEMKETEGAWVVYAARAGYGGVSSGIRYAVSNYGTPQYSAWGNVRAVGYGAIGGLFGWNSWSSATFGAAAGAAGQRWVW